MYRLSFMLVVVDYGMGNLRSVSKALERAGGQPIVSSDPAVVRQARQLVVPGVGAGPQAMQELRARGLIEPIVEHVRQGKPYLGICLGLQLLFDRTEEAGGSEGFQLVHGTVRRFESSAQLKVPQIGWNRVTQDAQARACPLFHNVPDGSFFYFVHSYYADPQGADMIAATTDYGRPFVSAVWRDNLYATQFHPEKSQRLGLQLLSNFLMRCR